MADAFRRLLRPKPLLLVRNGVFTYAKAVDFLTYLEPDGTSHRGGEVTFTMPDGEVVTLRPKLVDAVLHEHGGESECGLHCAPPHEIS